MILDRNEKKDVIVLLGAGSMGTAIVKRIAAGKKILLGDINEAVLERVSKEFSYNGYDVDTFKVDALDTESVKAFAAKAASLGEVKYFIDTAGASPNQAKPEFIIALDLVATAYALDIFSTVIAKGGAGLVISSQTGYMPSGMTAEEEQQLALTPTEKLGELAFIKQKAVNSGAAYIISKRANHLRVRTAAATTWGDRGARINSISPGIIVTPLAYDEFQANGEGYQYMLDCSPAKRAGTSEEIAEVGAFLLSDKASFITGVDILIDGGVIAAMNSGRFNLTVK